MAIHHSSLANFAELVVFSQFLKHANLFFFFPTQGFCMLFFSASSTTLSPLHFFMTGVLILKILASISCLQRNIPCLPYLIFTLLTSVTLVLYFRLEFLYFIELMTVSNSLFSFVSLPHYIINSCTDISVFHIIFLEDKLLLIQSSRKLLLKVL